MPTKVLCRLMTCRAAFGGLGERGKQWTQVLSWEPRAFLYHNFLVSSTIRFSQPSITILPSLGRDYDVVFPNI